MLFLLELNAMLRMALRLDQNEYCLSCHMFREGVVSYRPSLVSRMTTVIRGLNLESSDYKAQIIK